MARALKLDRALSSEARRVRHAALDLGAEHVLERILATPVWLQVVVGAVVVTFYVQRIVNVYRDSGLFRRIGFDWGLFYAQALALAAGDHAALYQVDRLGIYVQRLVQYTSTPNLPLLQWPSPYPAALAAILLPLTSVPPPVGFAIWTVLSVAAGCHLVWRIGQLVSGAGWLRVTVMLFTSLPVIQAMVQGQPAIFLASAVAEAYVGLASGAEFRGGFWFGLLAIKPQYGLVLGLFLVWKRRWSAVAGAMVGVGVVVAASVLAAGPGSLLDYLNGVAAMGDFRDTFAQPGEMVNWRALIVNARPAIGNTSGIVLFATLAIATLAALAFATRQRWQTKSTLLDAQLAAVLVATFLVSYHSHMHGLVMLAVPLAGLWRAASEHAGVRLSILGFVLLPTAIFVAATTLRHGLNIEYNDPLWIVYPVANVALLAGLLGASLWRLRWA
jgi:alpha-1,2-mannosyltransferase